MCPVSRNLGNPGAPAPPVARRARPRRDGATRGCGSGSRSSPSRWSRARGCSPPPTTPWRSGRRSTTWARATWCPRPTWWCAGCGSPTTPSWTRYFRADDELPADLELTRGVGAGELLPRAAVGAAADADRLQVPIEVPPGRVPPSVDAGAVVDVYVARHRRRRAGARRRRDGPALTEVTVVDAPEPDASFGTTRPAPARARRARARRSPTFFALLDSLEDPVIAVVGGPDGAADDRRARGRRRGRLGVRGARRSWARPGIVVLKRCVDVDDLLADRLRRARPTSRCSASTRPGWTPAAVDHLRARTASDRWRSSRRRPGGRRRVRASGSASRTLVADDDLDALPEARDRGRPRRPTARPRRPLAAPDGAGARRPGDRGLGSGRRPGSDHGGRRAGRRAGPPRAAHDPRRRRPARRQRRPSSSGILDEVSGLLAAARLDGRRRSSRSGSRPCSAAIDPRLSVVTGLPRPDRWVEVRPGAVEQLLETAPPARPRRGGHRFQPRGRPGARLRHPAGRATSSPWRRSTWPTRSWWWARPTRSGCPGWCAALAELRELVAGRARCGWW